MIVKTRPEVISRKLFVKEFGARYQPSQHVTILGPTGRGKTRLVGQLIIACVPLDSPVEVSYLHGKIKGRDATIEKLSKTAKLPITSRSSLGPFDKHIRYRQRRGYIVRPLAKAGDSGEEENRLLADVFGETIRANYHTGRRHPKITIVNEAHQAHNDLGLKKDCEAVLMRGRPDNAMWSEIQRARFVSYMCYDQPEHIFMFKDTDRSNTERYSEIGGVDARYLRDLTESLETQTVADGSTISQCLYFRRSGDYLCIVDI